MPTKKKRVYKFGRAAVCKCVQQSECAGAKLCVLRIVCAQNCVCSELCVLRIVCAQSLKCQSFQVSKFEVS